VGILFCRGGERKHFFFNEDQQWRVVGYADLTLINILYF